MRQLTPDQIERLQMQEHIGDGVYVQYDGYSVIIRVNDHRSPPAVTLEPNVLIALTRFMEQKSLQHAEFLKPVTPQTGEPLD